MFAQANVHPLFTTGVVMNQSSAPNPDLKLGWLLDNQSTDDIACNHDLVVLGSIVKADQEMRIHTNAGVLTVTQKCRVASYPQEIWFSAKGMASILSFKYVLAAGLLISYDCSVPSFTIHHKHIGQKDLPFVMHPCGLHYYRPPDNGVVLLNTVNSNKEGFTK
jgi:hypothetical protein